MRIPIGALELARFATKDGSRENMQWIQIRKSHDGALEAVATNTHLLGHYQWFDEEADELTEPVHLWVPDVQAFLKRFSKKEKADGAIFTGDGLRIGEVKIPIKVGLSEVGFPHWDQVIPDEKKQTFEVGMNTNFLVMLNQWAKAGGAPTMMRVGYIDGTSPVRFDSQLEKPTEKAFVIVMPCRI